MANLNILKSFVVFSLFLLSFSANTFGQGLPISKCVEEDYDAQIAEATKGIEFSAYNLPAFLKRASAFLAKGKYDEGLKDLNQAIKINPKSDVAFFLRGTLYAGRANYDRAIKDFSTAIELNPEDADIYYERARSYPKNESILSINDYTRAIELKPEFAQAYYGRGREYYKLNESEKMIKDINIASEIITKELETNSADDCHYDSYLLRGIIYDSSRNFSQALTDYNQAIKLRANYSQTYYYRGTLHIDNRDYRMAIDDLTKAIELNPNSAESYKQRALAYDKIRENEKADTDRKIYEQLSSKQ